MSFPTIEFAAFFAVVLLASWLLMPHPRAWKPFMVAVSLGFLSAADWRWAGIVAVSVVLNHIGASVIARQADSARRKAALIAMIAVDLGLLGWFKYLGFFVDSVNEALAAINLALPLPLLQIALPIGLSFFTLQAIGYVVDVYRRETAVANPWDYAVFASFFPHAIAGPILRARDFMPQLAGPRDPRAVQAIPALFLIVGGLAKKIVVADLLAVRLVDPVFANPGVHSALDTGLAILGYAVQIYCDFSAYADIAIGTAMLLGFKLSANFDRPYAAASLRQFWRRWNMTLTSWMRDYVYVPLGGDRRGQRRTYINLVITVMLAGLWHGAAATFLAWAAIHAIGLCAERWLGLRRRHLLAANPTQGAAGAKPDGRSRSRCTGGARREIDLRTCVVLPVASSLPGSQASPDSCLQPGRLGRGRTRVALSGEAARRQLAVANQRLDGARDLMADIVDEIAVRDWPRWSRQLTTLLAVAFAWVFFRAVSLSDAADVLGRLATGWSAPTTLATPFVVALVIIGLGVQFVRSTAWGNLQTKFRRLPTVMQGVSLGACLVVLSALAGQQVALPFIFGTL